LTWTVERFRNARDALLDAEYITVAKAGANTRNGRTATQYTLAPRRLAAFENEGST